MKKRTSYAFIGGGNMGTSLIGGLIADGCPPSTIAVADPSPDRRAELAERFRVTAVEDNATAVRGSEVVVLAVKPQTLSQVALELRPHLRGGKELVISIAAGIRLSSLQRWLGDGVPVVRAMPNTPALVQCGATLLCAGQHVSQPQSDLAESVLRAVGITVWVGDERLIDAGTALSGSGPAYFFLTMEAIEQAAMELGLDAQTARLLTVQTALGAARLALESTSQPAELRTRVTSPGGTTEAALRVLERGGIRELYRAALLAARDRSVELSDLLGEG